MNRFALLVASFGYAGRFPVAPGTAGSAAAVLVFVVVRLTGSPTVEAGVIAILAAAGVWSATLAERQLGVTDPSVVVIDEVVGMLVTLAFMPLGWKGVTVGFVLFRLFDIMKPYPCARAERLRGGWGIMADDVIAGLYANIVLRVVTALLPGVR